MLTNPDAAWRKTPVTEGQRHFLRRFRVAVPAWTMKAEATELIGLFKENRWAEARRMLNGIRERGPASA